MKRGILLEEDSSDILEITRRSLERDVSVKPKNPESYASDGWIQVESIGRMCAREEALVSLGGIQRSLHIDADMALARRFGEGAGWAFQNRVWGPAGVLRGAWRCLSCGHDTSKQGNLFEKRIPMPKECPGCKASQWNLQYKEEELRDETLRIKGRPDGFLWIRDEEIIVDTKVVGVRDARTVKFSPLRESVIQVQTYLGLARIARGVIVYLDRTQFGVEKVISAHWINKDDQMIESIKDSVRGLWNTIRRGGPVELPRVCATPTCERAQTCGAAGPCWGA